jgi:hypothetical protein
VPGPHARCPAAVRRLERLRDHHWSKLDLTRSADAFAGTEAVAVLACVAGGDFRFVQRLLAQTRRIMKINDLSTVTEEVVEAARSRSSPRIICLPR